jgi:prepilin-type N-terminal cleavage/methylation domain-containing protein
VRREDGFTIPEFLVGMVVLAIILAGFGQVLINSSKTSNRVEEQAMLQNDVRASIQRLTTDLRSATNVHDDQPIVAATASTLTFDSPDRATPFHLRRISYRVNGTNLERSQLTSVNTGAWPWTWPVTTPVWTPEVTSLTGSSVFTYYDGDGAVTTDPTAVRTIRVTLSVKPKQTGAAPASYSAVVTIRTLS